LLLQRGSQQPSIVKSRHVKRGGRKCIMREVLANQTD
jgi:hypothetical protein